MANASDIDKLYTCTICCEIFTDPMTTSCGHVFCKLCLNGHMKAGNPNCPICRAVLNGRPMENHAIQANIYTLIGACQDCSQKMVLSELRSHSDICPRKNRSIPKFQPVGKTSQKVPSDVPNRSTFACPYCSQKNLDVLGLVKHCNDNHQMAEPRVVCPVCASMPWGDPTMVSNNFIQHLNMRHKFEYDTYVAYDVDDDDMLQAAIRASLQQ